MLKLLCTLVGLSLLTSFEAAAAVIEFDTPDRPLSSITRSGLRGTIWLDVPFADEPVADRDLDDAREWMSTNSPSGYFRVTTVDYPNGPADVVPVTESVAQFLGADAASLKLFSPDPGLIGNSIIRFSGFLRVEQADTLFEFNIGSDDGAELIIQDRQVFVNDGIHAFSFGTPVQVRFANAGLYALAINYFEGEPTEAGIEFTNFGQIVPQSALAVPTPGVLSLLVSGLLGLSSLGLGRGRHCRARAATNAVDDCRAGKG